MFSKHSLALYMTIHTEGSVQMCFLCLKRPSRLQHPTDIYMNSFIFFLCSLNSEENFVKSFEMSVCLSLKLLTCIL